MTGQFGMFPDRETRDAWVAERDRQIATEAVTLARIGITGPEDLCAKYGQLCHLYETGELPQPGEFGLLTSDEARAFADKVLIIMYGGPWRAGEEQAEVTHKCPPDDGGGLMPCCGLTPFEVPRTDRMTMDPALVTCGKG